MPIIQSVLSDLIALGLREFQNGKVISEKNGCNF